MSDLGEELYYPFRFMQESRPFDRMQAKPSVSINTVYALSVSGGGGGGSEYDTQTCVWSGGQDRGKIWQPLNRGSHQPC